MTVALVRMGAVSVTAAASVTPAFGQATTAGNVSVLRVMASIASATALTIAIPTGYSGARIGSTGGSTGVACLIAWKASIASSETAPTVTCTGATRMAADLTEWSGLVDPLGRVFDNSQTDTTGAMPSTACSEDNPLVLFCDATTWTKSQSITTFPDVWTGPGTVAARQSTTDKAISQLASSAMIGSGASGTSYTDGFAYTMSSTGLIAAEASVLAILRPAIPSVNPNSGRVVAQAVTRSTVW